MPKLSVTVNLPPLTRIAELLSEIDKLAANIEALRIQVMALAGKEVCR